MSESGTAGIGGYAMRLATGTATADNAAVDVIFSDDNANSWIASYAGSLFAIQNGSRFISFAATGKTVPLAFTSMTGKLGIQAYINKTTALDVTKPIALDGLSTIELVYL